MERELRGILLDLDETLYSREVAFWNWIEMESQAASVPEKLDREKVAELDQRGRATSRRCWSTWIRLSDGGRQIVSEARTPFLKAFAGDAIVAG
jgi:hypothetical protein